ncbi:CMRF35-like molecule 7 [Tupaia chinensis]|nr:CMRF35-like molecule 7 [Tupaia chinensis]
MWLPPALLLLSLPGCFSIEGPGCMKGSEKGSVTVQCRYDAGWETYKKWWCRGASWEWCSILVRTQGSEQEEKSGRVSIRDNWRARQFTVTMELLRQDDAGTYWCGIQKFGTDLGARVKVIVEPEGKATTPRSPPEQLVMPTTSSAVTLMSFQRTHYVLLVFVKVPILLVLVGAVLWLKGSRRVPENRWEQPVYINLHSEILTNGPAP